MTDFSPSRNNDLSKTADRIKRDAANTAHDIGAAASSAASDVKNKASQAYESGKEAVSNMSDSMMSTMSGVASDASRVFKDTIEEQKNAGAGAISDLAKSARESADGFEEQSPQIANAVRTVAGKIEAISNDIKDKTLTDMVDSVSAFARQQPLAFWGCGVLAGFVLARLVSTPARRS